MEAQNFAIKHGQKVAFAGTLHRRLETAGVMNTVARQGQLTDRERAQVIRVAYELLEEFAASDVADLSFELSDYETIRPPSFENRLYSDVVTLRGGLMIEVMRAEHRRSTGIVTVQYVPKWVEREPRPIRLSNGQGLEEVTVAQLRSVWRAAGYPEVHAITTYRVTATLRQESRSYQAAFLWHPSLGGPNPTLNFMVADEIGGGVQYVITEGQPPIYDPGVYVPPPEDRPCPEPGCSVLLLDFDGVGGPRLTSLREGVRFELDHDGVKERTAWTEGGTEAAFLATDLNGNGVIENGDELFTNRGLQPDLSPGGSFVTLALYDEAEAGGNEDGRLSAEDLIFSHLLLWTDHNHDGLSQRRELVPLDSRVQAIDLDYQAVPRTDAHGNRWRHSSTVHLVTNGQGISTQGRALEVILAHRAP